MRICLDVDETKQGGGWTFARHFKKMIPSAPYEKADIYFITGASMVDRPKVLKAKQDGKKIVLRVDNALRPSRNRGGGMTHMKDYADLADLVIYQSEWAQAYLSPYLNKSGPVIHNATDLEVFNDKGRINQDRIFGYSRLNRDETKNYELARYLFSMAHRKFDCELWLVGNFSPELVEYNFDFFENERYKFWGPQPPEVMAQLYRQIDFMIIPFLNDACSNTVIEALVSGCELVDNPFLDTGGTPELLEAFKEYGKDYFGLDRMRQQYVEAFDVL